MEAEYVLEAIARSKINHSSEAEICIDIIREYIIVHCELFLCLTINIKIEVL